MKFFKILSLIATLFMTACGAKAADPDVEVVSPEVFQTKLAEDSTAYLLDVRKPDEFAAGHLADAHLLNWLDSDTFKEDAKDLDKAQTIYVYCRSGRRSNEVANYLAERGYRVVDMDGGILAWEKAGLPVTTDNGSAKSVVDKFIGTYTDVNDGSTLEIGENTNAGASVKISLFRLTDIDDGIGRLRDGTLDFSATDAAGSPIEGKITFDNDTALLTFTKSTWEYLPSGTSFSFVRNAVVNYEAANPIGGRTYTGGGNGGGLATNITIKFQNSGSDKGHCECTSDFYQAFAKSIAVKGFYSISEYGIVTVKCQPEGFESPIVWNFEIINDGQELGFNNSDSTEEGSLGNDWLRLKAE